jgi:hypothetical protein
VDDLLHHRLCARPGEEDKGKVDEDGLSRIELS